MITGYAHHTEHHDQLATTARDWIFDPGSVTEEMPDNDPTRWLKPTQADAMEKAGVQTFITMMEVLNEFLTRRKDKLDPVALAMGARAFDGDSMYTLGGHSLWAMMKATRANGLRVLESKEIEVGSTLFQLKGHFKLKDASSVIQFLACRMGPVAIGAELHGERFLLGAIGLQSADSIVVTCSHPELPLVESYTKGKLDELIATRLTPCYGLSDLKEPTAR